MVISNEQLKITNTIRKLKHEPVLVYCKDCKHYKRSSWFEREFRDVDPHICLINPRLISDFYGANLYYSNAAAKNDDNHCKDYEAKK